MRSFQVMIRVLAFSSFALFMGSSSHASGGTGNPCNPCNPCAAKEKTDPKLITRPAGTHLFEGKRDELLKEGERLWNDRKLSTNGLSCNTCHANHAAFNATFEKPYPHFVKMAKMKAGLTQIALDEMVQFCLLNPMAAKPLPWDSKELAALTAYTAEIQKTFKPHRAGGAAQAKNPCNPCGR